MARFYFNNSRGSINSDVKAIKDQCSPDFAKKLKQEDDTPLQQQPDQENNIVLKKKPSSNRIFRFEKAHEQ